MTLMLNMCYNEKARHIELQMKPNKSELFNIKNWVNTWKEAGVLLDNMNTEELSQLSEIDAKKDSNNF